MYCMYRTVLVPRKEYIIGVILTQSLTVVEDVNSVSYDKFLSSTRKLTAGKTLA